jgi:hypothetical protein
MPRSQTCGRRAGCERPRGPRTRAQAPQAAPAPRPAGRRAPRAAPAGPGAVGLARHGALARHQVAHQRRGRGRLHGAVGQRRAGQAQARGVDQRPVEHGGQRGRRADRHGDGHHHALWRSNTRGPEPCRALHPQAGAGPGAPRQPPAPARHGRRAAAARCRHACRVAGARHSARAVWARPRRAVVAVRRPPGGQRARGHDAACCGAARHVDQVPTAGRMCGTRAGAAGPRRADQRSRPGTLTVATRAQRRAAAPG